MQTAKHTSFRAKQIGVTLLEVMLVLAIGASLLVFAISQYKQFKDQQDVRQLQLNLDKLFSALSHYYQAYCGKDLLLDPTRSSPVSSPYAVSAASLVTDGFLPENWNAIAVPFVDSYVLQLNLKTATKQNVYACWNFGSLSCNLPSATATTTPPVLPGSASVYIWTIQVGVVLNSDADPTAYKNLLGANCLSTSSGSIVTPCTTSSTGTVLVFERIPSATISSSNLWMLMPQLKQFNMQYTHDQMYELSNGTNAITGTAGAQPYLCGG